MTEEIDVSDIAPHELLAALYNRSRPQGLGHLHATPDDMTPEQAEACLKEATPKKASNVGCQQDDDSVYFDYLKGRVMKVEINGNILDPVLYDRDLGQGAAQSVVDSIREQRARTKSA